MHRYDAPFFSADIFMFSPKIQDISFVFQIILCVIMLTDCLRGVSKHLCCHDHIAAGNVDDFCDGISSECMGSADAVSRYRDIQTDTHPVEELVNRVIRNTAIL